MTAARHAATGRARGRPSRAGGASTDGVRVLHVFLIIISIVWLFPLAVGRLHIAPAVRRHDANGYLSLPATLNLDNYVNAWNQAELAALLPEHARHRRPGGHHRAVPRLDDGLRRARATAGASTSSC